MKPKLFLTLIVCLLAFTSAFAQAPLDLEPNDSMQTVLQRQVGQTVELRMTSGEKLGGKLEKVNEKLAYLSQITGTEYFSGMVRIDNIAAVVVRAKK